MTVKLDVGYLYCGGCRACVLMVFEKIIFYWFISSGALFRSLKLNNFLLPVGNGFEIVVTV